ncbi:hypothetical protein [Gloeobacter kilaueensis]|uniref:Uncharacterized protein n=1 Tax=Gloeobacter kilaueensis (strain ATCC BAA-2537 / CCAP 1431/1 / ULC 316 / JS1) TaxID=1183438 RepID=U5QPK9_GLOK1|nr:hypothetical protein [Gloeobacter kilaueensis]AGY59630.1 hypothetical protein GKIL_3384 [Gloeobacter kilaueensis JS1]
MTDALIQAIRTRNLDQAERAVARLRTRMSTERVASLIVTAIEKLAWEEGDTPAAMWLLKNTP